MALNIKFKVMIKVVRMENMFEVLHDIHISVGYQGIASMKPKANVAVVQEKGAQKV